MPEEPGDRQYLSIDSAGSLYLGATPISYEGLPATLGSLRAKTPGLKLFLRADVATAHRYVNRVMAACAQAGIYDLIFGSNKD